ncbi:hypothetical protein [Hyalangium gracile]|uniref:hypothetical protein n=1 Tax=Hyalangium gracile TaxID=394092 RepID=UPI001CC92AE3|nr:hypothetical protein [Hyalangium gracile]
MSRSLLLLLAVVLPTGIALGQEAGPPGPPPPATEPAPPPEPVPPRPPPAPPGAQAPDAPRRQEPTPEMETLISGKGSQGGYGGPVFTYSRILDRDALLLGGRGGWIANHHFVFGAGGFALLTRLPAPEGAPDIGEDLRLDFAYGGLWLEYILLPDKLVHASIGTLVGGGVVGYSRPRRSWREDRSVEDDVVFVAEPTLAIEMNVLRFLRLALGTGYRYVGSVDLSGMREQDLSGFTGSVMFKFGRF